MIIFFINRRKYMAATPTIYGFIQDTLFWKKKIVDLDQSVDTGVGFLNDLLVNYFHKIGTIRDPRKERENVLGETVPGEVSILFDVDKMDPLSGPFANPTDEDLVNLFNIMEKIYLTQDRLETELNRELVDNQEFSAYVSGSLRRSTKYTSVSPDGIRTSLRIFDFIEFTMKMKDKDVHFKLWLSSKAFAENYPLTTICVVVPPCEPKYLIDPSGYTSIIQALVSSAEAVFADVGESTALTDHTGTLGYKTRWVISSQNIQEIQFGIMYQGRQPTSLEVRKAIRDYLLGLSIAPEDVWESRLPDLFVVAEFYLIPMWEDITYRPDNKYGYVYPAICNHNYMINETYRILPDFEVDWLEDKTEVLTNPFNPMFLTAVPDPLNEPDKISMLAMLDTYQAFGPDDTNYMYQEAPARNFSRYLAVVMSILYGNGAHSLVGLIENEFFKRKFLSFVVDRVEYHVLFKESYRLEDE